MPNIRKIKVVDPKRIDRDVCVVNGQPFYCSTGTSKDERFKNIWLPFKGFGENIPNVTGMFHKPDVASSTRESVDDYFKDSKVAQALEDEVGKSPVDWGRFQDTACLKTTCQLSKAQMKEQFPEVLSTMEKNGDIGTELTLEYISPDEAAFPLRHDTIHDLNDTLRDMGATLSSDMDRNFDPKSIIENAEYNPMHRNSVAHDRERDSLEESRISSMSIDAPLPTIKAAAPRTSQKKHWCPCPSFSSLRGTPRQENAIIATTQKVAISSVSAAINPESKDTLSPTIKK